MGVEDQNGRTEREKETVGRVIFDVLEGDANSMTGFGMPLTEFLFDPEVDKVTAGGSSLFERQSSSGGFGGNGIDL